MLLLYHEVCIRERGGHLVLEITRNMQNLGRFQEKLKDWEVQQGLKMLTFDRYSHRGNDKYIHRVHLHLFGKTTMIQL